MMQIVRKRFSRSRQCLKEVSRAIWKSAEPIGVITCSQYVYHIEYEISVALSNDVIIYCCGFQIVRIEHDLKHAKFCRKTAAPGLAAEGTS